MKHTIINVILFLAAIACVSCEDMLDFQPKDGSPAKFRV